MITEQRTYLLSLEQAKHVQGLPSMLSAKDVETLNSFTSDKILVSCGEQTLLDFPHVATEDNTSLCVQCIFNVSPSQFTLNF